MRKLLNVGTMRERIQAALIFEESKKTGVRKEAALALHYLLSTNSEMGRAAFKGLFINNLSNLPRSDAVIPLPVEIVAINFDVSHLRIGDDQPLGVLGGVKFGLYREAATRLGIGNQVDDDLMTDQRAATPVHRDE